MANKKPDYENWSGPIDLKGETPDSDSGRRIIVWLWIIGMFVFSGLVWGLAELMSYMRPGMHGDPFFNWLGGHQ